MMITTPNFFIVGAPKCGTTAWAEYLGTHRDICFPKSKEPHYFNIDFPNFRWAKTLDEYLDYFTDCQGFKVVCDASVQYLYSKVAARRIADFAPNARVLIMLREPESFIRSYHNQLLLNFDEIETDLRTAWQMSGKRPPEKVPSTCREPQFLNYKRVGMFSEQVSRFLSCFPAVHIKVVFMEDWIDEPRRLYVELMDFLTLLDDGRTEFPVVHSAKHVSNRTFHRISQRPPTVLKKLMPWVRRIPGLVNFRPSHMIRQLNLRSGYNEKVDYDLMSEIQAYFSDDQVRLSKLLEQLK
ncbi:MAG: sulfotransferase domain-containing protein [Sedimentisphaerales bacterium]|nr:sulfotransferase domain-containing protein [Sedimentisphaerales bacterium]